MKRNADFLSLAAELRSYILSFLPWQDVLRCSSVCKVLHLTYMSSSELQYIVELGGQRLLPVSSTDPDNVTSIAKRLQLLRDKAHAWFEFDKCSFRTVSIPERFRYARRSITGGHLCLWNEEGLAKIFPILPKPSQQTIERDWSLRSSHSVPNAHAWDVFMDPAQNLIATAYATTHEHSDWQSHSDDANFYIGLTTLDVGGIHPQAAGPVLFLPGYENRGLAVFGWKLKVLGSHVAFQRSLVLRDRANTTYKDRWWLQIWDWQHSTTSNCILDETVDMETDDSNDFCFLGSDRLLVLRNDLKLYSIEDVSQAPQLLARFLLPLSPINIFYTDDSIARSSAQQMQIQQTMQTSDPQHRIICLSMTSPSTNSSFAFIISTNIFFNFDSVAEPIMWKNWGSSNVRVFRHRYPCNVGVSGNRVLLLFPDSEVVTLPNRLPTEYRLRMMDFSPLAAERRQGLGRVVKEPSTVYIDESGQSVMTSLPYVEVVSDKRISYQSELPRPKIWVDSDRIIWLNDDRQLEVIEI
ncbi:hypothetical protein AZE42_02170 [Rhizopogon vesiculosus]|uniref:F-box domain-containing protein n=1 Tax=Rhizopogon vesiculosus TaxID=180088 RepID=A0A1J8PT53_9AGAM|nr:hypothetical protein AZE42_02170 [Rhizopogon vesiculosus]